MFFLVRYIYISRPIIPTQRNKKAQVRANTEGNVSAQGDVFIFIPLHLILGLVSVSISQHPTSVKARHSVKLIVLKFKHVKVCEWQEREVGELNVQKKPQRFCTSELPNGVMLRAEEWGMTGLSWPVVTVPAVCLCDISCAVGANYLSLTVLRLWITLAHG